MKTNALLVLILMTVGHLGCRPGPSAPEPAASEPTATGRTLTLGKISDDPLGKVGDWQPLADYLESELQDHGIASVQVRITPDLQTMASWISSGQVDIFFDNAFAVAYVKKHSPSRLFATRIKTGEAVKSSVFMTSTSSGIDSIDDLAGRTIGLDEPESASGFLLPVVFLLDNGLRPVLTTSSEAAVDPGEVGYIFTHDEGTTVFQVLAGRLAAGVVDNEDFADFQAANPGKLVTFAETESITRNQPGLVGERIDEDLEQILRRLLSSAGAGDASGERILPEKTLRFAHVSPADAATVEDVTAWIDRIESQNAMP